MEQYTVETENYLGHNIKIYQDPEPENPREWHNLGTMICFHKRYTLLGDKHGIRSDEFDGWGGIKRYLIEELDAVVVLPLYLYDHSGITMKTSSFICPWDSGQIGFIYVDRDTVLKEYGKKHLSKNIVEMVTDVLEDEVKIYDQYLTRQVYGFVIEDVDGKQIDSCWGCFDEPSAMIKECELIVDDNIEAMNKKESHLKVNNITIDARRWFQKTYGNTYHSVRVYVNNELIGDHPLVYGHGEQYLMSAFEILSEHGIFSYEKTKELVTVREYQRSKEGVNKEEAYSKFTMDMRENRQKYHVTCVNVGRQRDL